MSRPLHPLLSRAFASGYIEHDGRRFELHSNIPEDECRLLYRQVEAVGAASALEIGMAYGISSVALADALRNETETPSLVSIDPYQNERWDGVAVGQLERAGYRGFCELIEAPSHAALPVLVERGTRVDLAFIDGLHTFDHCLVDFFFIDLLLRPGGVVVFDDTWMPGVRAVVEFVLRNRAYELVDSVALPTNARTRLGRAITGRGALAPASAALALRKTADDERPWHDFRPFAAG